MADSSCEKGLEEIARMKVTDLRAELKKRNLPFAGKKEELIERLQSYIHGDTSLSLDETVDDVLDEDAVLEDDELEELAGKPDSQIAPEKRKLPSENNGSAAKKVILNRNPIIEEVKVDEVLEVKKNGDAKPDVPEKKIIKLSKLSTQERLEMRAKKFGIPPSETSKKEARAARFKMIDSNSSSTSLKTSSQLTSVEVLKKRAERFGSVAASPIIDKMDMEERIEKRKARFGEIKPNDTKTVRNKIKIIK